MFYDTIIHCFFSYNVVELSPTGKKVYDKSFDCLKEARRYYRKYKRSMLKDINNKGFKITLDYRVSVSDVGYLEQTIEETTI